MPGDGKDAIGLDREMKPVSSGCADVNGIKLYHEIYGQGEPLVLIHGGLMTIGEMQEWVHPLANTRRDIAALLNHLKIPKADVVGHSFGGAIAIRAAIQHPDKVRRLVVISSPHA